MFWSFVLAELGAALGDTRYTRAAAAFADEVFRDFYRPNRNAFLEFVRLDGGELPPPLGTAIVPGHAIESMWFQLHVANLLGTAERSRLAVDLIARHLELGWDSAGGGGLLLAIDADGRETVGWKFADTKLWWPHTEALYAALLAWKMAGAPQFLQWYDRLWRFCLRHYVDWEHGEWRQKLGRDLQPLQTTIALPVKDPFHLPRSLILQIELLRQKKDARTNGHAPPGEQDSSRPNSAADSLPRPT
jgi:N-acylglucosamine 2-epimerase